tara:strand:- start:278 stop:652 length:375 start_codon:yes stop_codon:yes gene_type:complete
MTKKEDEIVLITPTDAPFMEALNMSVFDNYDRDYFRGPVFGGSRNGEVIITTSPIWRCLLPVSDMASILSPQSGEPTATDLLNNVETYLHSKDGFWYEETLGEDDARERFLDGNDVEAWADDDA